MTARSGTGFDLSPLSADQRKLLEAGLTAEEADVLLHHGTEAPFCGVFLNEKRTGTFTCRLCGLPLFRGINSVSLDFTPSGDPLPDKLGRGVPEGRPWQSV
jgi:hypothetical protein